MMIIERNNPIVGFPFCVFAFLGVNFTTNNYVNYYYYLIDPPVCPLLN